MSQAWNTSWATSAGWNGASNGNGAGSLARWLHARRSPAFFARRLVSSASAPVMTARSKLAVEDRRGRVLHEHLRGVVPPMPE